MELSVSQKGSARRAATREARSDCGFVTEVAWLRQQVIACQNLFLFSSCGLESILERQFPPPPHHHILKKAILIALSLLRVYRVLHLSSEGLFDASQHLFITQPRVGSAKGLCRFSPSLPVSLGRYYKTKSKLCSRLSCHCDAASSVATIQFSP